MGILGWILEWFREPHTHFPELLINSKYSIWRRDRLFKQRRFLERKHREKVDPLSLKYEELFFVMFSIFSSLIIFPCIIKDNTINILSYGPGVYNIKKIYRPCHVLSLLVLYQKII